MDGQVKRWWIGFTVALFLLVPVDLLTTLASVAAYGSTVEANPFMRWLLGRGLLEVVLVHLAVVVLTVASFHVAVEAIRGAPASYRSSLVYGVDAWLTLAVATGIVVVVNNLLIAF